LPTTAPVAKAGPQSFGGPMSGIYMILVFLAVMAALNRFEFGRFD
jgi:ribose/xylose/arabinose/galactoside ABC-type transport system permease subunit